MRNRNTKYINMNMLGDHILYSHDFSDSEGLNIAKRNLMLITIGAASHVHLSGLSVVRIRSKVSLFRRLLRLLDHSTLCSLSSFNR